MGRGWQVVPWGGTRPCCALLMPQLAPQDRVRIVAALATRLDVPPRAELLPYILEDVRGRLDLAFAWLYREYSARPAPPGAPDAYDRCLLGLLGGLQEKPDQKDGWGLVWCGGVPGWGAWLAGPWAPPIPAAFQQHRTTATLCGSQSCEH